MFFRESNRLLEPGYMTLEAGYYRLPNGQMHVAALTRMPRCKGKMVDWWFGYLDGTEKYKMWDPESHIRWEWDEHWRYGQYIGASSIVEKRVFERKLQIRIHFRDPAEFLETSTFEEAQVGAVICANVYDLEKIPLCRLIHLVRDTHFGCEMRSRFWLFHASDKDAGRTMQHCIEEMGRLADLLPDLYNRENVDRQKRAIV